MTAVMPCDCTHLKVQHAGATYACRDCPCKRYTPDIQQAARAQGLTPGFAQGGYIAGPTGSPTLGESTSARLRRVEQERDELKLALGAALDDRDWADRAHADDLVQKVADANDLLRAELASARTELEQLRAQLAHTKTEGGTDA